MLSDLVIQAKLIPPSVRAYAASCAASGISPRKTGSWRLELDNLTLTHPIRGVSCLYCTGDLKVDSSKGLGVRRLVCEGTMTVLSPVPEGTELIASKIVLHQPARVPITAVANTVVSRAPLTPFLSVKTAEVIYAMGNIAQPIPSHLKSQNLFVCDAPRQALPAKATLTTEKIGFSIWHLIALGLFEREVIDEFLASLNGVPLETLRVDMSETMSSLNDNFKDDTEKIGMPGLSWTEIKELTAWRSTFEICVQTRRPFLGAYTYDAALAPPIVTRLVQQTKQRLGIPT